MAGLILPNRFKSQPQYAARLDKANPLYKRIRFAYSAGRGVHEAARGVGSVTGSMTYGVGPKGRNVQPSDASSYIGFADCPDYNIVGGITVFALITVGGTTVQQHVISKASGGGGSDTPWAFGLEFGGYIFLNRANAGFRVWQSGTALTTGQTVVIAATQGADISVAPKFYINGILDGVASTSLYGGAGTGAPNSNTEVVKIGNRGDLASQFFGVLYDGSALNTELPGAEVAKYSENIYAIWQAPTRKVYVNSVSSTSGVGSSSGIATVAGVGAASSASVGSSSGLAAVSGIGASFAASVGSSAGSATVSGVGTSSTGSSGSSSGLSTVSGVGASLADSVGSSSGSASISGVGSSIAASVGSSDGSATVSGVGDSSIPGSAVGSAAGSSSVSGVGASVAAAIGSASGSSSALAVSDNGSVSQGGDDFPGIVIEKRRKKTLAEQPNLHLQSIIDKAAREVLPEPVVSPILELNKNKPLPAKEPVLVPAPEAVISPEVIADEAEKVAALLAQYQEQVKRMQAEEDEELLLLIMGAF